VRDLQTFYDAIGASALAEPLTSAITASGQL
jgi:hypothetical protein